MSYMYCFINSNIHHKYIVYGGLSQSWFISVLQNQWSIANAMSNPNDRIYSYCELNYR